MSKEANRGTSPEGAVKQKPRERFIAHYASRMTAAREYGKAELDVEALNRDAAASAAAARRYGSFYKRLSRKGSLGELRPELYLAETAHQLQVLAFFIFFLGPLLFWASIMLTDETAIFASISRMLWITGNGTEIYASSLVLCLPMIISFIYGTRLSRLKKWKMLLCQFFFLFACGVLFVGALMLRPGNGIAPNDTENIWHGIMSGGGMLLMVLAILLYAIFLYRDQDRGGAKLIMLMLVLTVVTTVFNALNVFDEGSYVGASAITELYVLIMVSMISFLIFYLAYAKARSRLSMLIASSIEDEDLRMKFIREGR